MEYLADTVTVIRHFSKTGKIGKRVKAILQGVERGEHHLYISTISLVEIMYLSEKNRIIISLKDTLKIINNALNYSIVDLRSNIVQLAEHISIPDIFDRLIVATAKFLEIALLTCDKRIIDIDLIQILWD